MKTKSIQTYLINLASALIVLFGASCRTVQGFGQDVEHAGDHIQESAR